MKMTWVHFTKQFCDQRTLPTLKNLSVFIPFILLFFLSTPTFSATQPAQREDATTNTYRMADGSFNNLDHPTWGSTNSQLLRVWYAPTISTTIDTQADYADGISQPPGDDRPSPRAVSNAIAAQSEPLFNPLGVSDFFWQWGQFIDHDLDLTEPQEPHEPFPIPVPQGDPIFDPDDSGIATIQLNRSAYDPTTSTPGNPRQQVNQITTWLDGSQIYGSTQERADWIRTFSGGKLRMSDGDYLPFEEGLSSHTPLFGSGDVRVNEQIGLIALHTLFVREHNRLATLIAAARPDLDDESLYQITRALVIAEMQIITYEAFLPTLLGPDALPAYRGYNPNIDPAISNIFATGAYRFGHTMLPSTLLRLDENGDEIAAGHVPLRNAFFHPQLVLDDGVDPILRGLAWQQAQAVDTALVDDVRNFLFGPSGMGFDLAALNIQRGRDHGLPTYNAVRVAFGLPQMQTFADITSDLSLQNALAAVYDNDVDKIDLWVGGLSEDHLAGTMTGETYHAILTDQFTRLRDGDRFWHQAIAWTDFGFATADPPIHQNGNRLSEITLSKLIEWNTEIRHIQADVFFARQQITQVHEIDLQIALSSAPKPATPGQILTYTITYTNSGPAHATHIEIRDALPFGLQFKEVISQSKAIDGPTINQGQAINQGQDLLWMIDSLHAGHSGTLIFTVETAQNLGGAFLLNSVEIRTSDILTTTTLEINPADNHARVETIFQIGGLGVCCPTAAEIVNFSAHSEPRQTHLSWETASEHKTLGFYIYRSTGSHFENAVSITGEMLPGVGKLGGTYHWTDDALVEGMTYRYWLVEVTENDAYIIFGPISPSAFGSNGGEATIHHSFFPLIE